MNDRDKTILTLENTKTAGTVLKRLAYEHGVFIIFPHPDQCEIHREHPTGKLYLAVGTKWTRDPGNACRFADAVDAIQSAVFAIDGAQIPNGGKTP